MGDGWPLDGPQRATYGPHGFEGPSAHDSNPVTAPQSHCGDADTGRVLDACRSASGPEHPFEGLGYGDPSWRTPGGAGNCYPI